MRINNFGKAVISIATAQAAGGLGTIFTSPAIGTWYATLSKPSFNPPNWIFGPVWTTLFLLMGIALFLVWKKAEQPGAKKAIAMFGIQLALNVSWSAIFFGAKNPGLAFLEIIVLWLAILYTAFLFCKISKPAGWLLVPYLGWVAFASILNYAIWQLN